MLLLHEAPADLEIAQLPGRVPVYLTTQPALADPDTRVHQPDMSQAHAQQQARDARRVAQTGRF